MQPDAVIIFPDLTDVYDDNARYQHLAEFQGRDLVRVHPSKGMAIVRRTKRMLLYDDVPLQSYRYLVAKVAYRLARDLSAGESEVDIFEHALDDGANPSPKTLEAIRSSIANMRSFVNHLLTSDVHVAIMIYPHRGQIVPQTFGESGGKPILLNRLFEASLVRLGRELDVPVVSFYDGIAREVRQGRQLYFRGDMHFNIDGLRTLSTLVTETLLESSEEMLGISISLDRGSR
jgi:hypothetical protein